MENNKEIVMLYNVVVVLGVHHNIESSLIKF